MAKMTLIQMVQDILLDMGSDDVTSYTDTVESQQVANIIRDTYDHIIVGKDWPHLYKLFTLSSTGTNTPTRMLLPETLMSLDFVKYNRKQLNDDRERWEEIPFVSPKEFLEETAARNSESNNVQIVTDPDSGVEFNIFTDKHPTMYTSFSEISASFDGYNGDVEDDARLFTSNTMAYGKLYPSIVMQDSLIFPLPIEGYTLLLEEAKSTAFLRVKEMPDQKAEQRAITQRRRMSQKAWSINRGIKYPDYGRKGKGR